MNPPDAGIECEAAVELLEELLDGELEEERERALSRHLSACPECAGEFALATTLRRELRALPEIDAPAALIDQVLEQTQGRAEKAPKTRTWTSLRRGLEGLLPRPARWAAATLVAAALALLVWLPRSPVVGPEPASDPELARAILEARFALAYLGELGRGTGRELRDEVLRDRLVVPAVRSVLGSSGDNATHNPMSSSGGDGTYSGPSTQPPEPRQSGPRRS